MFKVAVIGGGIFGCEISALLQESGISVTLFDKNLGLLQSTSRNNSRRLHLGFHYPRHLETARQSLRGAQSFSEKYGDFILGSFANYYALAKDSRTNIKQYETFLKSLGAPFISSTFADLSLPGLRSDKLIKIYQVPEPVIKVEELAEYFAYHLLNLGVTMILGKEVTQLRQVKAFWEVSAEDETDVFDGVVLATHSQDKVNIISSSSRLTPLEEREFHLTQILVAKILNFNPVGLTIIDGNYLTMLPINDKHQFSIYSPLTSRLKVVTSRINPFSQDSLERLPSNPNESNLIRNFYDWFEPEIRLEPLELWHAIRNVPAQSQKTDQRMSYVDCLYPNLLNIYSAKLDHSIEIAEKVHNYFKKSLFKTGKSL